MDRLVEELNKANISDEDKIKCLIKAISYVDDKSFRLNDTSKHKLCRGIAHFIFRNGPIEDMHADGKLSQEDMKVLNKFMMNQLGKLYDVFVNKQIDVKTIEWLFKCCENFGIDWDDFDKAE